MGAQCEQACSEVGKMMGPAPRPKKAVLHEQLFQGEGASLPKYYGGERVQRGAVRYYSGAVYEGSWRGQFRDGPGMLTLSSGTRIRGQWVRDALQGKGEIKYKNSEQSFQGQFVDNKICGQGVYRNGSSFYKGQWKDDLFHGIGEEQLPGQCYQGEFACGLKQGKGKLVNQSGTYEGEFSADNFQGYGVFRYNSGTVYSGEWRRGKPEGKGRIRFKDGSSFVGSFREGRKDGAGVVLDEAEKVVEREVWRAGKKLRPGE